MRRWLFSVVLASAGALAFQGGVPRGLKPGASGQGNGVAEATPLRTQSNPGLKPNDQGDVFTGLKPGASTLIATLIDDLWSTDEAALSQTKSSLNEEQKPTQAANRGPLEWGTRLVYTSTSRYDREAWLKGGERFPAGAQVMVLEASGSRALVSGFAATADASVAFDGTRALFAGRKQSKDLWQIWEVTLAGGEARQITKCASDCVRPFYLPGGRLVYAQKQQGRFVLQSAEFETGKTLQLSYAPGNAMPTDVLRDGRILFEASYPMGSGTSPEIYTVYSDGSGVESYRCDHGARRQAAKQSATGDIVFASGKGLARFTSALAHQVDLQVSTGEFAGDVASVTGTTSPKRPEEGRLNGALSEYVVAWRADAKQRWSLVRWSAVTGGVTPLVGVEKDPLKRFAQVSAQNKGANPSTSSGQALGHPEDARDADLVEPVLVQPRAVPNQHPSGLHDWAYANLLCLNAYTSKQKIAAGSVAAAKLYTADANGKPRLLGNSPVEADGSFYVQVPGDQALQIELLDAHGKTVQREQGWWWARKGEQRICVGCHAGPERAPENAVPQVLMKSTKPVVMK